MWDGNEVWLLVAGGATFAAFPVWYASLFCGFYLALLLILVALILRGVAFEYRGKVAIRPLAARLGLGHRRRLARCPRCCGAWRSPTSSAASRSNAAHVVTGNLLTLLNPYALLGGLVTLTLFALHGAIFLALKTDGGLRAPGPDGGRAHRRSSPCRWPPGSWWPARWHTAGWPPT